MQNWGFWEQLFIWFTCKIRQDVTSNFLVWRVANKGLNIFIFPVPFLLSDCMDLSSLFWARLVIITFPFGFLRIVQHILASCVWTLDAKILPKSLLPAVSLFWALYFEKNNGPPHSTSSISSSFQVRLAKLFDIFFESSNNLLNHTTYNTKVII